MAQENGWFKCMKERNEKKAKILYDFLDESKLFKGTVEKKDRSLMNVTVRHLAMQIWMPCLSRKPKRQAL